MEMISSERLSLPSRRILFRLNPCSGSPLTWLMLRQVFARNCSWYRCKLLSFLDFCTRFRCFEVDGLRCTLFFDFFAPDGERWPCELSDFDYHLVSKIQRLHFLIPVCRFLYIFVSLSMTCFGDWTLLVSFILFSFSRFLTCMDFPVDANDVYVFFAFFGNDSPW